MARTRAAINRAIERGDTAQVNELLQKFLQILRERQRLGLRIPKASTQALQQAGMGVPQAFPGVGANR